MAREFGERALISSHQRSTSETVKKIEKIHINKNGQPYVLRDLISETECEAIKNRLSREITADYEDKSVLGIIIAKGGIFFGANMIQRLGNLKIQLEYTDASSYGGEMLSSGIVSIDERLRNIQWGIQHAVIFEDIIDTGLTMQKVIDTLNTLPEGNRPQSVKLCALLSKPSRRDRRTNFPIDYLGTEIPDAFVVGEGLDYDQKHRAIKGIKVVQFIGPSLTNLAQTFTDNSVKLIS
jgi:hypoxanthine phosphoribosyltransferase